MTLPEPLTPVDCDLQDFPFMPLQVARLRDSDLAAEAHPEGAWYAVMLWSAAWHQLPAASLPNNDTVLMKLAGLGRDMKTFKRHREDMLRGFVECADGRLYHPVVAEQAVVAWTGKLEQRWRTECARIKKANQRNGTDLPSPTLAQFLTARSPTCPSDGPAVVPEDTRECPSGHGIQEKEKEKGTGKEDKSFALVAADAPTPDEKISPEDVRVAFGEWNELARRIGLPAARDFTDDRRKKIAARLRAVGLDGWRSVLATIEASDFCRGGGERGWRISLEDLFQTKTWNKLRDGGYGSVKEAPGEIKPEVWAHLIAMWRAGEGWPDSAGPAPNQPGTRVPSQLLIQPLKGAA